jgi:hypothetical protein
MHYFVVSPRPTHRSGAVNEKSNDMNTHDIPSAVSSGEPGGRASDISVPQLVGEVYESAPPIERAHLLEPLLRPLGVLSLLAVADGVFANVRFRSGWQDMHVRLEDIQNVRGSDVSALVDYAQRVSVEAVDGLAQTLAASPVLAGSAAAWLLVTVLVRRAQARRGSAAKVGARPAVPN